MFPTEKKQLFIDIFPKEVSEVTALAICVDIVHVLLSLADTICYVKGEFSFIKYFCVNDYYVKSLVYCVPLNIGRG